MRDGTSEGGWPLYWRRTRGHALRALLVVPVISTAPFVLLARDWRLAACYTIGVPASVFTAYAVAFAVLTAMGPRAPWPTTHRMAFHLALSIGGMLMGVVLGATVQARLLGETGFAGSMRDALILGVLISFGSVFYFGYQRVRALYAHLAVETVAARDHALKTQLAPHFLFNSLNGLAEMIEADPALAASMAQKLADLYRRILAGAKTRTARVAEELDIVGDYLDLETVRYGARLRFEIVADADVRRAFAPSLMLQTLVENAVKHGIAPSGGGGKITVEIVREAPQKIVARVTNTGATLADAAKASRPGTRTGLEATQRRLELLYGLSARFRLQPSPSGGTEASFQFTGENLG